MAPSITPPLEPGPPAQPDGGREDPLSDFPAEEDLRRAASPSRLLKGLFVAAVGLVALLVVVFALQRARNGQRAAGNQEGTAQGTVRIESTPPGARVWSAGRDLGITPVSFAMPPGTHTVVLRQGDLTRSLSLQVTAGMQVVHHVELAQAPRAGALHVETTPPGARVFLDGTLRGTSPLDLADVEPGEHVVSLESPAGSSRQRVRVAAGGVASLVVPLTAAAGWVSIASPVELQLFEGGTLIGSSRMDRVMLSAGEHRIRLVNADIGFETAATVRVQPGAVTRREVAVPNGTISVNAIPWAEVFIDGARIGETPIANHAIVPGSHEVVLRNPKFAEQRRVVTVSLKVPARLGVDMRQ